VPRWYSLQLTILLMYTIQLTQSPKVLARAYCPPVPSVDSLWNLGRQSLQPNVVALIIVHRCHLGKTIVYDTVSNLSWSVDSRTHSIATVVEKVLNVSWAASVEIGREVPEAVVEEDCVVHNFSICSYIQNN